MSQAFVKEYDDEWLNEIAPSITALINYLTRENNGIRVYEQQIYLNDDGKKVHVMSNGFAYAVDNNSKWYIVE